MQMDPETKAITPVDYLGVKAVSFGFAGQGSAIMRGPMVSGLIQQLLLTAEWGDLDYLIVDFPPGTGVPPIPSHFPGIPSAPNNTPRRRRCD